ncbi:hypothetical protein OGCDGJMD_00254 [Cyanobium usitatum str. Tous]|nr:hypothetical protein OGCDGJMD_00254 [Cyanobium usitatum str. Tous]
MCGWRWPAPTTAIREGVVLHGHRARSAGGLLPATWREHCDARAGGGWDVFHQLLRTDAYLAAVAMANGWRLVSFDRDFERFEGLERLALPGAQA